MVLSLYTLFRLAARGALVLAVEAGSCLCKATTTD